MSVQSEHDVVEFQISVNDAVLVEVLEGKADLSRVKPVSMLATILYIIICLNILCAFGAELSSLDVQHEITTTNVLHDEVDSSLGLETGVEVQQKGVPLLVGNQEHPLLRTRALHFVILDNELLLQNLDGVQLLGSLGFSQHDLSKVSFTQHSKKVEMVQSYPLASALRVGCGRDLLSWHFCNCG